MSNADAAGSELFNATRRNRMSKGWPSDVGGTKDDPSAAQSINQRDGANRTTSRKASALDYMTYETVPGQQQHVTHQGQVVGYVQKYNDPGHGALWSATIADQVHARRPDRAQTQRGFVHSADAAHHVMDAHREVAQIESSGVWRPGPINSGPNLPGH